MRPADQRGGYQLLKLGLAGSLDAGYLTKKFRISNTKLLERVFGADRVEFYKALLDSVRDFKSTTRKTDKRSEAIKVLHTSKEELAVIAKNVRDQLAAIAPEKLSKLTQGMSDKDRKMRMYQDLLRKVNTINDDVIKKKNGSSSFDDDDMGGRRRVLPFPMELNKYLGKEMTSTTELEARIREEMAVAEAEQADTTGVSTAITAIMATQSFLADAGQLVIRTRLLAKMSEMTASDELNRDDVVITTSPTIMDAEFFAMLFGKLKALTQKMDAYNSVNNTVSPTFQAADTNIMVKGLERYRGAVENILRYFNNISRETDEAIRAMEKESKSPLSSSKSPSVSDVRAIYNAHHYERQQRMERVSEIAIELRNLVRKMESARRDMSSPDVSEDLRKRKETEFDYECLRVQKKIDKNLDDYPEMREMYLQICKKKSL